MTVDEAIQQAIQHHRAGRLAEAEAIYRQILSQIPNQPDALRLLGMLAQKTGHQDAAIDLLSRAIQANPALAEIHASLGNALAMKGRLDEAIAAYQKAIQLKPDYFDVCNNLGNAMQISGKLDEAIAWYQRAVEIKPDFAEAWSNLGQTLLQKDRVEESVAASRRAIKCKENFPAAHVHLGSGLAASGKLDEAIVAFQRAIELNPNSVEAYNNLGNALKANRQFAAALVAYERAIQLRPDATQSLDNLLNVLNGLWVIADTSLAVAAYERAARLRPASPEVYNGLGNIYLQRGQIDEAIASYRRGLELKPESSGTHSNMLLALNYHGEFSPESVLAEHRQWVDRHAHPVECTPHGNDPSPTRRLRVGYVSGDFCRHVVGFFFLPLLENQDRSKFEIFCYANVNSPDSVSEETKRHCDVWRDIVPTTDEAAAKLIREDQIDILVDLSGHTAGNRLPIFAYKPAPIQMTYLGYANTTGMTTIDYRLTDNLADPPGMTEKLNVEQLWRLAGCAWCYQPSKDAPEIQPRSSGPITFGCFNAFSKVTPKMLELWAELLNLVPGSRLLVKSRGADDSLSQKSLRARLAVRGITSERIEMIGWIDDQHSHWDYYNQVDIALDTYPYHGTTTTCETLWMGVPVVTLMGRTHVSRVGVSLLTNAGLPELIARTPEEYLKIAAELAGNPRRLDELRGELRERLRSSSLLDARRFAGEVESAYRQMWMIWCARQNGESPKRKEFALE
jgi:protein O-GlcNAc transferase